MAEIQVRLQWTTVVGRPLDDRLTGLIEVAIVNEEPEYGTNIRLAEARFTLSQHNAGELGGKLLAAVKELEAKQDQEGGT